MNLAVKDIRHNLGRFALTTVGIGLLLMMVMGMGGIYQGIIEDAVLLVNKIDADLWVVQRDTRGPFAEISRVPRNLVDRVAAVPGVGSAREFVYHPVQRTHDGKPLRMVVVGLSWPTDRGDWLPLVAGRPLRQGHYEMIADGSLGLALGDRVSLGKETYGVVGVTDGMPGTSGDGLAFFTIGDAQAIQIDEPGEAVRLERAARRTRAEHDDSFRNQPSLLQRADLSDSSIPALRAPQISAVTVRVAPQADVADVVATVERWGDVSVYSPDTQRELLLQGLLEKVRRQIGLFRILLTVISAIIMALILYTMTLDKIHDIALLKLIGAPNRTILGLILQQALLLGGLGYCIAYIVGQKVFPFFPRRVVLIDEDLVQLAVAVLVVSVVASGLGIWKALIVAPNEALSG